MSRNVYSSLFYLCRYVQLCVSEGRVVELLATSWSTVDPSRKYQPVIKFTDDKGTQIQFSTPTFISPSIYNLDKKVQVIYNPESPNEAKIKNFSFFWVRCNYPWSLGYGGVYLWRNCYYRSFKKKAQTETYFYLDIDFSLSSFLETRMFENYVFKVNNKRYKIWKTTSSEFVQTPISK